MKKKICILTVVVILLSLMLLACGEPDETTTPTTTAPTTTAPTTTAPTTTAPTTTTTAPTTEPTTEPEPDMYGGIYKQALSVGPATPIGYPAEAAPDAYSLARPAIENLVKLKRGGRVEPCLATSWEIAADGKSITLTLRQGVKFHDGSDFNAAAVKWNFDIVIEAGKARGYESVDVIDDYTVRINITNYQNTILTGLAGGAFEIISPTAVETNGLDWARWHPVGTGPFIFVEYERDARLVYERNPNYWDEGLPYLDGLEYTVIADEMVRNIAFQNGDIHRLAAAGLTAQELQEAGFINYTEPGGTFLLIPDSKNPDSPFYDIRVRQAVSHAIDREALVEALGYGFARPAYQVYPGFPETDIPDLDIHEFDQDKARQLLADAGHPNGFETTIYAFGRIVPRDFITAIVNMLGEVGIVVDGEFPEAGKYSEYRFDGWNNAMMGHAMTNFDNMNSGFSFYFGGIQFPSVQKPAGWEEALDAALATEVLDPVKTRLLAQLMHDEVMVIPYLAEDRVAFFQEGVHIPDLVDDYTLMAFIADQIWLDPELR